MWTASLLLIGVQTTTSDQVRCHMEIRLEVNIGARMLMLFHGCGRKRLKVVPQDRNGLCNDSKSWDDWISAIWFETCSTAQQTDDAAVAEIGSALCW
jgi:hypothetical protein